MLAGAQSKAVYLFFMTQDALAKFEASDGWTASADASIIVADVGANAAIDTKTAQAPIVGFVGSSGAGTARASAATAVPLRLHTNTMRTHHLSTIAIAVLCAGQIGLANAAGRQALTEGMPFTKFSDEDRALMMARVNQALQAEKEGDPLAWKNDKSPASGSVTALNRVEWNGLQCRRLQIYNVYGDKKAIGVYKFCEKPAGKWKLVGPD